MHWSIDVMRDFFPKCNRIETNSRGNCKTSQNRWTSLLESKPTKLNFFLLLNILSIIYISFCSWLPRMLFCKTSQSRWTMLLESEIFNLVKRAGSNISLFFQLTSKEALLERQRKMIGATKKIFEEAWEPHQESWIYFWHPYHFLDCFHKIHRSKYNMAGSD